MKMQLNRLVQTALISGTIISSMACSKITSTASEEQAPFDIENSYLSLSSEVQKEFLGIEARSRTDVLKELMARADKDGDGQLSEQEKNDLRAQWKELKEQMRAELKASLDKDKDGEISPEEKKEGLQKLGQQIKTAIHTTLEEIRIAQQVTRDKIRAACSANGEGGKKQEEEGSLREGNGRPVNQHPADELDADLMNREIEKDLNACQTVVKAEKDKIHEILKTALEKLHAQLDELKQKQSVIEEAQPS